MSGNRNRKRATWTYCWLYVHLKPDSLVNTRLFQLRNRDNGLPRNSANDRTMSSQVSECSVVTGENVPAMPVFLSVKIPRKHGVVELTGPPLRQKPQSLRQAGSAAQAPINDRNPAERGAWLQDSGEHLPALLFRWMKPIVVTGEDVCRYGHLRPQQNFRRRRRLAASFAGTDRRSLSSMTCSPTLQGGDA